MIGCALGASPAHTAIITTPAMQPGTPTLNPRKRLGAVLVVGLFLAYLLISAFAPRVAMARGDLPIQLQAVCHSGPGPVSFPADPGDLPDCSLPCCAMCCGAAHTIAYAPPPDGDLRAPAPRLVPAPRRAVQLRALHGRLTPPPLARGPPARI